MTLLAIELGSLNSEIYIPIIKQTLQNVDSQLYIVIFLTPELLSKLNSPAKRAGRCQRLQELISALYVCTATKREISCDIIFADWCGYSLPEETWEYSILSIPECNPLDDMGVTVAPPEFVTRLPRSTMSVRTVTYVNNSEIANTNIETVSMEKDHPVVAGYNSRLLY